MVKGAAPALGGRVACIMTKAFAGSKGYEKPEDPIFVLENNPPIDTTYCLVNQLAKPGHERIHYLNNQLEHNLPIDTMYHLNNQFAKPRGRIFEPILCEIKGHHVLPQQPAREATRPYLRAHPRREESTVLAHRAFLHTYADTLTFIY
ncbi:hypothetical protein KC318_g1834 [Hortaea werneckii]|nr:hypothetical protein KC334_g1699 [Hortaea werneckii]KAI7021653.1 hypothetical protein KC355_g2289 [Hortaea werneckii]KAI7674065.1 hypothetical protein KC318_g1834 [Hortaea werneckii]